MKNFIIGFFMILFVVLCGVAISTSDSKTLRKNEIDNSFGKAMEETMSTLKSQDPTYKIGTGSDGTDNKEVIADIIQNFLVQMDSDSDYEITIYTADVDKGLLDASVTASYKQLFGTGKITVRKTVVVDQYTDTKNVYYKVTFKDGDEVLKVVDVHWGSGCPASSAPQRSDIKGWKVSGKTYTTDLDSYKITKDTTFTAVK